MDINDVPWVLALVFLGLLALFPLTDWLDRSSATEDRRLIALQYIEMTDPEGVRCGHYDDLTAQVRKDNERRLKRGR